MLAKMFYPIDGGKPPKEDEKMNLFFYLEQV